MAYYNRPAYKPPGIISYICGWLGGMLLLNMLLLLLGWIWLLLIVDAIFAIVAVVAAIGAVLGLCMVAAAKVRR